MSQNKNALLRYRILDQCFSNFYKQYFIDDLIEVCSEKLSEFYGEAMSVSKRQIADDINFMKSLDGYDAPIRSHRDGRRVYYRYEDRDFSIEKKPLSPAELSLLSHAAEALGRVRKIPGMEWVNTVTTHLTDGLKKADSEREIISFQDNEYLNGIEFLSPLYGFIKNEQVLNITYKSFLLDEAVSTIISPYYLKQYNNRWFLFGHNHQLERLENMALDRIVGMTPVSDGYEECTVNFEEYFEEIIGVTNYEETEIVKIEIRVSDELMPYIASKPLHGSQRLRDNVLHLEVKPNYELESQILSFGEGLTVLSPIYLKEKIGERVRLLNKKYNED